MHKQKVVKLNRRQKKEKNNRFLDKKWGKKDEKLQTTVSPSRPTMGTRIVNVQQNRN